MGITRWFVGSLLALTLCFSTRAQISTYGYDQNPTCALTVAGEPPPPPRIGTSIKLEWWFGDLFAEEIVGSLFFGTDFPVGPANICHHSTHPAHLIDRWLLVPPLVAVARTRWTMSTGVPPWSYIIYIPASAALVGQAVRIQAFSMGVGGGGSPCDQLRATNALRIQFMPISP